MVETEGKIERRIAEPRAFGVQENRTVPADENVLRADVPMHQRQIGGESQRGKLEQRSGNHWMATRRRFEIRLEPDRVKNVAGRKTPGDCDIRGGLRMNPGDTVPHGCGEFDIDIALAETLFP